MQYNACSDPNNPEKRIYEQGQIYEMTVGLLNNGTKTSLQHSQSQCNAMNKQEGTEILLILQMTRN